MHRLRVVCRHSVDEVTKKFGESLTPRMSKLPGFGGYFLIEAGEGVLTSINLFETSDQAHESTRVAATWIREEKLETVLPNTPKAVAYTRGPASVGLLIERRRCPSPSAAVTPPLSAERR